MKKEGTEISELEKSINDIEESIRLQKSLLAKHKPNYEKRLKQPREAKDERAKRNTTRVLRESAQTDDVSASGSAVLTFVFPLKEQSRISNFADGASESVSKKSAKFDDNHIEEPVLFRESTMPDAAEEASAAVESSKKKRKVVSNESEKQRKQAEKAAIKAKKDAKKAEKEAKKARKKAERLAKKEEKEVLARQKALNEESKMLKEKRRQSARRHRQS